MGRDVGERLGREGTWVHLRLILLGVWQKTTKFCKTIILQLKKNNKVEKINVPGPGRSRDILTGHRTNRRSLGSRQDPGVLAETLNLSLTLLQPGFPCWWPGDQAWQSDGDSLGKAGHTTATVLWEAAREPSQTKMGRQGWTLPLTRDLQPRDLRKVPNASLLLPHTQETLS